jgi:hypothetical protein
MLALHRSAEKSATANVLNRAPCVREISGWFRRFWPLRIALQGRQRHERGFRCKVVSESFNLWINNGNYPSKSIVYVAGLQGVRRKTRNWFLFNAEFSYEPWFAE